MSPEELAELHPRLWHMAQDGSWPSISERGLLSTSALLDLYEVQGAQRAAIETALRRESIAINKTGLPEAVIRDQKPMSETALVKCLRDGLTPGQWCRMLNEKVFFWPSQNRLRRLLGARAYRSAPQVVLTIRTESLVAAHGESILLSPINSGSTIMNPQPRGKDTFLPLADYPFEDWAKKRSKSTAIAEVVIPHSVPDMQDHVIAVHRIDNGQRQELWRREGSDPNDGP